MKQTEYIKKDDALEYVLENYYDEVREAVFEQEAESRQEWQIKMNVNVHAIRAHYSIL